MEVDSDEEVDEVGKRVDKLFEPLFSGDVVIRDDYMGGWGVENIERISVGVMERGVSNIMEKLSDDDIEVALKALRSGPRSNDDHLETSEIKAVARKLIDHGVTCADIARLSGALAILNTTMADPMETSLASMGHKLALARGLEPLPYEIPKALTKPNAVHVTIGRMLLKLRGFTFAGFPVTPIDEGGRPIDEHRWTGLHVSAAKRYLGVTRLDLDHINAVHAPEMATHLENSSHQGMLEVMASLQVAQRFRVTEHERRCSPWC